MPATRLVRAAISLRNRSCSGLAANGMPTARTWAWLCSGYRTSFEAIAAGAGVSTEVARDRVAMLLHNRLVYPDGSMSKWLLAALKTHVAKRLGGSSRRKAADDAAN